MLKLRPAIVIESDPIDPAATGAHGGRPEQRLLVQLTGPDRAGERRRAIADVRLVGASEPRDRLIVNVQALDLDLELGAGGCDVVHVNLTRGLVGAGTEGAAVMKLGSTSLQHAVVPVDDEDLAVPLERPTAVLASHGQLAPVAWAFARAAPGMTLGYVQGDGGALPGGHSRTVALLREQGLLAGHLTAGPAFGGDAEAITTAGAIHHGLHTLGWDAAVCGPGPGMAGSASSLGHGGMAALDSAHVALALGCPTLLVARMSSGEERRGQRGISQHTLTVLDLLLEPVTVALPAGMRSPVGNDLRAGLGSVFAGSREERPQAGLDVARPVRITRHDWRRAEVDLPAFAASGLPARTIGRTITGDPLFFASALAGGAALAELVASSDRREELESA